MKRIKIGILLTIILLPITNVYAAGTASISANSSVVNGNNITATVTLRNMAAWNIQITGSGATNGCSVKQVGDSGDGRDTTKSFSLTCKATKIGTITFSYSGDITSADGTNKTVSGSKTVNVVKPREKSTNNNLKNLSVDGYTLSPEFNKDTLEYTVNLESNVEKITINATKEDGYASVSGDGEKEVQEGDNKFEITVTSETGVSKVYTINAIVKDSNPIEKQIDGKTYTVVKRASALNKPELFEETTVTIQDMEIPAFYNEITKITLIGLKDEEGTISLYRYDVEKDSYSKFESLTSTVKTIIFENTEEEIEGFEKKIVTIENQQYSAYQSKYNEDYILIYGIDIVTGNKAWYLYNIKEQTIQSYMSDIINNMQTEFDQKMKEYKIVLLGLAALSLLLLLIIVIQIASKNKMKKKWIQKRQMHQEAKEKEAEKQETTSQTSEQDILDKKATEDVNQDTIKPRNTKAKSKKKEKIVK